MTMRCTPAGAGRQGLLACQCLALCAFTLLPGLTRADTIDFGLPLEEVTILDLRGGEVTFLSAGSTLTRSLETVEAIYFETLPTLRPAETLRSEGKHEEAIQLFQEALGSANDEMQRLWLHSRLALVHGEAGQPAAALEHLALLTQYDADSHWLLLVPAVDAMSATPGEIDAARAAIATIRRSNATPLLDTVESVLDRIPVREAADPAIVSSGPAHPTDEASAWRFPSVEAHLQAGDAAQALSVIRRLSQRADKDDLPELYFQAGAALEQLRDPAAAGLCYLRIAAHFPDSPWAVRGLLATAHLYQTTFAKPDAALRLARRAVRLALAIDDEALRHEAQARLDAYAALQTGDHP